MGKQRNTAQEEKTRWDLLPVLHRECVRRNEEYGRQYEKTKQVDPKAQEAWRMDLEERWGLWACGPLPDPQKRPPLPDLRIGRFEKKGTPAQEDSDPLENTAEDIVLGMMGEDLMKVATHLKGFAVILYFPEEPGPKVLRSALDTRRTKKELQKFLGQLVDEILIRRKKSNLKQVRPPGRMRLEEMFKYLEVWDLRKKKNTFAKIAKMLWPGQQKGPIAWKYWKKGNEIIKNPPFFSYFQKYLEERARNRDLKVDEFNPPMVIPKKQAKFRGSNYVGQARMRLGPSLIRRIN